MKNLGMDYVHIPVEFFDHREENFDIVVDTMTNSIGKKIWGHCAANGRASNFTFRYRCFHMFRANIQLVMWNRFLRLLAVGRHLFFAAFLGLVLCYWILVSDVFEWQKGSGGFSSAIYGLLFCWSSGLVVLALLDARSRFQDYKRAKDLFFENGFKSRIAKIYSYSRCQRDAVRLAARDLGLLEQLDHFYQAQGYHWYHIFPDFVFKKPWLIFSQRYWRRTLFEPQYTSSYFFW